MKYQLGSRRVYVKFQMLIDVGVRRGVCNYLLFHWKHMSIETCKCKPYIVKHNPINNFMKVYFLHCFFQRHVSALVMSHLQVDYFS